MKSSKTTTSYLILLITVLMLFSSFAGAITEDFTAFASTETVQGSACDLTTDHITIHNTGDVTSTYILSVSGEAAEWTNLAPQTFYLEQGEIKQIERFIKVPCSARGEHVLNTTIKTLFDTEKVIEQTLDVKNTPNVQIIPKFSGMQSECPCTPVQYSFEIINTGKHIETYELSVEPFSKAISMSTDFLVLEPGQKEEVIVFINLACGEYGEKMFTLNALAQGTDILGQTEFFLDIQKCYDYEMIVGQEYNLCQGVPNIIPFTINNKADIANEYILTLEGAEWAQLDNQSIALWGRQTGESAIFLNPPAGEDIETLYSITLSAFSVRGEEIAEQEIILETEKCYDYALLETEETFKAVECRPKDHVFILQNTGTRETNYYVDLDGLEWLDNSIGPVTLQGGEDTELVFSGNTPCESAGEYLENIYVTIEEINQTYVEEKTFTIYPKEEAYLPDIEIEDLEIDYTGGETEIKITNAGHNTATYNLGLIASDWISLDTASMTLAPGENQTAWLMAYPTNETWPDVYAGELIARVAGEDIEYAVEFYVDLQEDKGWPMWVWAAIIGGGVLLLMVIAIILIIALTGKKKPEDEDKKEIAKEEKAPKKNLITIDKRQYRKDNKEQESTVKLWPILLFICIVAILAAGIYFAFSTGLIDGLGIGNQTAGNETQEIPHEMEDRIDVKTEPEDDGVLTNEDITESLITIDRSGVPGSGNDLLVSNQTELNLPLIITNPTDRKAKFEANNVDGSWVEFERTAITVMPETTETTNIKITPDLEALENNDYSVSLNTVLEGKKIQYQESLELVVKKDKPFFKTYWPWMLGGLVALIIILIIIGLATRKPSTKPVKTKTAKAAAKPKKKKTKVAKKVGSDDKINSAWLPIVIGILILLILGALSFWAYNTFIQGDDISTEGDEVTQSDAQAETPQEEPKLTEDDVEESLITIDRESVPGKGNVLKLEMESYDLPMSIYNPTDRKAKFTVSTSNQSWIEFDQYVILVGPQTTKNVSMRLVPDMDALAENDYMVSINTMLEGSRIDYEEELNFVLKENKPELSWWLYALIGLLIIGLVVLIVELMRRSGKDKPVVTGEGKKKKKKTSRKKPTKKTKDVKQINKEIADLRKKTVLKIKKGK